MVHSGNYSVPLQPQNQPPGHGAMPQQRPLSWSTPLVDVLGPLDFALEDPWATSHVTLDDAIGHRTGMPRHDGALRHVLTVKNEAARDGNVSDESSSRIASPVDVARMLRYLPLSAEPRMKFQYCNTMYTTLGLAVERLYDSVHGHSNSQSDHGGDGGGGKWLGHILRDWIWAPLGMHSTFFSLPDAQAAEARDPDAVMAQNYFFDYSSGEYRPVPPLPLEEVGAAGSVISSVADYARWMRALVARDDAVRASSVLTHDVLADMGTARTIISSRARTDGLEPPVPWDAGMAYGLGWLITSYRGYRILSHSGGTDGAGTEVFLVPELGFGVTTMANTGITSTAVGEVLAWRLIDDRLAVPKAERFDWDGK